MRLAFDGRWAGHGGLLMKKLLFILVMALVSLAPLAMVYCVICEPPTDTPNWEGLAIFIVWGSLLLTTKWFYLNGGTHE